jgi:hypothetical protein
MTKWVDVVTNSVYRLDQIVVICGSGSTSLVRSLCTTSPLATSHLPGCGVWLWCVVDLYQQGGFMCC